MKIRAGFVSNSSSSSFVCFAASLTEDELKAVFKEGIVDDEFDIWDFEGQAGRPGVLHDDDDNWLVGKVLLYFTNEDIADDGNIDIDELRNCEEVKLVKARVPDAKFKLYWGTEQT